MGPNRRLDGGFSLVEVIIATALLTMSLAALAELFAVSVKNNAVARNGTFTAVLAAQKMEQLRSLAWGFDVLGLPISDIGLAPSPTNTLQANADGYVDYLDPNGNMLGGGTVIPGNTAYIRRWYIEPLAANPNNTLVLQVLVTRRRDRGAAEAGSVVRAPEEARLITMRTRKAQ